MTWRRLYGLSLRGFVGGVDVLTDFFCCRREDGWLSCIARAGEGTVCFWCSALDRTFDTTLEESAVDSVAGYKYS